MGTKLGTPSVIDQACVWGDRCREVVDCHLRVGVGRPAGCFLQMQNRLPGRVVGQSSIFVHGLAVVHLCTQSLILKSSRTPPGRCSEPGTCLRGLWRGWAAPWASRWRADALSALGHSQRSPVPTRCPSGYVQPGGARPAPAAWLWDTAGHTAQNLRGQADRWVVTSCAPTAPRRGSQGVWGERAHGPRDWGCTGFSSACTVALGSAECL